jgi:hypothetical protein
MDVIKIIKKGQGGNRKINKREKYWTESPA